MADGFPATPIYDQLRSEYPERTEPIVIAAPDKRARHKMYREIKRRQDEICAAIASTGA